MDQPNCSGAIALDTYEQVRFESRVKGIMEQDSHFSSEYLAFEIFKHEDSLGVLRKIYRLLTGSGYSARIVAYKQMLRTRCKEEDRRTKEESALCRIMAD